MTSRRWCSGQSRRRTSELRRRWFDITCTEENECIILGTKHDSVCQKAEKEKEDEIDHPIPPHTLFHAYYSYRPRIRCFVLFSLQNRIAETLSDPKLSPSAEEEEKKGDCSTYDEEERYFSAKEEGRKRLVNLWRHFRMMFIIIILFAVK